MSNRLVEYITVKESSSIQWAKMINSNRKLTGDCSLLKMFTCCICQNLWLRICGTCQILRLRIIANRLGSYSRAMVLDNFQCLPGRPTTLENSTTRANCACRRFGWGLVWNFFSRLSISFSFSTPRATSWYRLKYYLKDLYSPKQPTKQ